MFSLPRARYLGSLEWPLLPIHSFQGNSHPNATDGSFFKNPKAKKIVSIVTQLGDPLDLHRIDLRLQYRLEL